MSRYSQRDVKQCTREIAALFAAYGDNDYDGEPVTQTSHMIQCAMIAMQGKAAGYDVELVLGALLHDIGHLIGHQYGAQVMGAGLGTLNHEVIGATFLRDRHFGDRVCALVMGHVAAKRFLVATDSTYAAKLSDASRQTLQCQGGPMTPAEVAVFRSHPYFTDIIQLRLWDEKAKNRDAVLLPFSLFADMIESYLHSRLQVT